MAEDTREQVSAGSGNRVLEQDDSYQTAGQAVGKNDRKWKLLTRGTRLSLATIAAVVGLRESTARSLVIGAAGGDQAQTLVLEDRAGIRSGIKETKVGKEQLQLLPPNVLMIDFAPERQLPGFIQEVFPDNERVIKDLLGKDYRTSLQILSDVLKEFGVGSLDDLVKRGDELRKKIFAINPKLALVLGFYREFSNHGEVVGGTMRDTWRRFGYQSSPYIYPIQEKIGQLEFQEDELGNKGLAAFVDEDKIIEVLRQYPAVEIVNFSFLVGNFDVFYIERERQLKEDGGPLWSGTQVTGEDGQTLYYMTNKPGGWSAEVVEGGKVVYRDVDGIELKPLTQEEYQQQADEWWAALTEVVELEEPQIRIKGAYDGKRAVANLRRLIKICNTFPDKFFVVAGGNFGEDFVKAREELEEEWPENLLILAEGTVDNRGRWLPLDKVRGPDLYVNNEEEKIAWGSSNSVPVISATAAILRHQGLGFDEIQTRILNDFSDPRIDRVFNPYGVGEDRHLERPVRVFNPEKFAAYLETKR